jgi:hypothetical protein
MKKNRKPAVSAIVVTYNSGRCILSCLEALISEIGDFGGDILVFDNNSTDNTVEKVIAKFPQVKIFRSPKNLGFAAANNQGLRLVNGQYVLFVNPDAVMDRGALDHLVQAISDYGDAGAVVGRMRNPDGSFQSTCREVPDSKNIFFSRGSVLSKMILSPRSPNPHTMIDFEQITEVPAAAATCMMVERKLFEQIGGFDDRFFLFAEDVDLSVRIRQRGHKVYFVPTAGAVHLWGEGARVSSVKRSWYHHMAIWKYFMKHHPSGFSTFVLPAALFVNFAIRTITGLDSK